MNEVVRYARVIWILTQVWLQDINRTTEVCNLIDAFVREGDQRQRVKGSGIDIGWIVCMQTCKPSRVGIDPADVTGPRGCLKKDRGCLDIGSLPRGPGARSLRDSDFLQAMG